MAPPCTVWKDAVHSAEGVSMIEGVPAEGVSAMTLAAKGKTI